MATFYVHSSRHSLGQRFSEMLSALFPGVRSAPSEWPELAERLAALLEERTDTYFVFREDLDDDLGVKESLRRDFGAALDDAIVEIDAGLNALASRRPETSRAAA